MALKPTIYKFGIALSDLDREHYDQLNLTVALHPSETLERMMVRVLAFCINAQERLSFAKSLSDSEEPDLWLKALDDQIELWIDVGEPSPDRIKKAARLAKLVKIYCFNTKSDMWWQQTANKLQQLPVEVYQLPWHAIETLASLVERGTEASVTITQGSAYIATAKGECEIAWTELLPAR